MVYTKLRVEVLLTEMPRFLDGDLAARCLGVKLAQIRILDRVPREIQGGVSKIQAVLWCHGWCRADVGHMNAPHRVTGVHAGTVLRGETTAQLNEAVAPALGHVRRSRSGVDCYVATST